MKLSTKNEDVKHSKSESKSRHVKTTRPLHDAHDERPNHETPHRETSLTVSRKADAHSVKQALGHWADDVSSSAQAGATVGSKADDHSALGHWADDASSSAHAGAAVGSKNDVDFGLGKTAAGLLVKAALNATRFSATAGNVSSPLLRLQGNPAKVGAKAGATAGNPTHWYGPPRGESKHNQHTEHVMNQLGFGWNGCGPVSVSAAAEALAPGLHYKDQLGRFADYSSVINPHGVQPGTLTAMAKSILEPSLGKGHVNGHYLNDPNQGLSMINNALNAHQQVIVDILARSDQAHPNTEPIGGTGNRPQGSYAHFTRVVGIDDKYVYLEETQGKQHGEDADVGLPLKVPRQQFMESWHNPEVRANNGPSGGSIKPPNQQIQSGGLSDVLKYDGSNREEFGYYMLTLEGPDSPNQKKAQGAGPPPHQ